MVLCSKAVLCGDIVYEAGCVVWSMVYEAGCVVWRYGV